MNAENGDGMPNQTDRGVTYAPVRVDVDGNVCCAACGETYGMEAGETVHAVGPDRDEYDSPAGSRGGWIETRGDCSCCGQRYSFIVGNHKGALCLRIAALGKGNLDDKS